MELLKDVEFDDDFDSIRFLYSKNQRSFRIFATCNGLDKFNFSSVFFETVIKISLLFRVYRELYF